MCESPLTLRSRWTMLFWWRKATPSRICFMSLFTSSSVKASSSRSDTHWLKISPPAALRKNTHIRLEYGPSNPVSHTDTFVPSWLNLVCLDSARGNPNYNMSPLFHPQPHQNDVGLFMVNPTRRHRNIWECVWVFTCLGWWQEQQSISK